MSDFLNNCNSYAQSAFSPIVSFFSHNNIGYAFASIVGGLWYIDRRTSKAKISTLEENLSTEKSNKEQLNTEITALKENLSTEKSNKEQLNTKITALEENLSYEKSNKEQLNTKITALEEKLSYEKSSKEQLNTKITALEEKLSCEKSKIANLTGEICALKTRFDESIDFFIKQFEKVSHKKFADFQAVTNSNTTETSIPFHTNPDIEQKENIEASRDKNLAIQFR